MAGPSLFAVARFIFRACRANTGGTACSFPVAGPAFWRGSFDVVKPGDTFLDVRNWGKGVVWVNGHCLGRFWNIGPTQTMYLPGPWLQAGRNEIIVLDLPPPPPPDDAGVVVGVAGVVVGVVGVFEQALGTL